MFLNQGGQAQEKRTDLEQDLETFFFVENTSITEGEPKENRRAMNFGMFSYVFFTEIMFVSPA